MRKMTREFRATVVLMMAGASVAVAHAAAAPQEDAAAMRAGDRIGTAAAIESAVEAVDDGVVRLEFAARPDVWGNGSTWNFSRFEEPGPGWSSCPGCTNGPVRVTLRVRDGVVRDVDSQVGGTWRRDGVDVGPVAPPAAADYLLDLAGTLPEEAAEEALPAAVAARDADVWPRLLELAKDRSRPEDLRSSALFWVANEAGHAAIEEIEEIAVASEEDSDVQEAAVFALTQLPGDGGTDALLRIARDNRNPDIVQAVYFWLGQSEDPRALALFEEVLLD